MGILVILLYVQGVMIRFTNHNLLYKMGQDFLDIQYMFKVVFQTKGMLPMARFHLLFNGNQSNYLVQP